MPITMFFCVNRVISSYETPVYTAKMNKSLTMPRLGGSITVESRFTASSSSSLMSVFSLCALSAFTGFRFIHSLLKAISMTFLKRSMCFNAPLISHRFMLSCRK